MSDFFQMMFQGAAGAGGAEAVDVDNVFSAYVYEGNGANRNFINGIDLSSDGGLVWVKNREGGNDHILTDTERGVNKYLETNTKNAEATDSTFIRGFRDDGFSLGTNAEVNGSNTDEYGSLTFKKHEAFFDIQTWSGNSVAGRTISHNLNATVGCIMIKRTDAANYDWIVYHRDNTNAENNYYRLNAPGFGYSATTYFNSTAPTTSEFTVSDNVRVNATGGTYVAYIFAHNDGDGIFGPNEDQDIIACGSYDGDGTLDASKQIDLGWEPQWVLIVGNSTGSIGNKNIMVDRIRGAFSYLDDWYFAVNTTEAEQRTGDYAGRFIDFYGSGFIVSRDSHDYTNRSGSRYSYIAIRKGPLSAPEDATTVFAMDTKNSESQSAPPVYRSGFPVDMALQADLDGNDSDRPLIQLRKRTGRYLTTSNSNGDNSFGNARFDFMNGYQYDTSFTADTSRFAWMWKAAPSFCDVQYWNGNSSTRTIKHGLGVAPEFVVIKMTSTNNDWHCGVDFTSSGYDRMQFNGDTRGTSTSYTSDAFITAQPTTTGIQLGNNSNVNGNGQSYIGLFFSSCDGVSKVGTYTGNGVDGRVIDCGFSSGARFVMIKRMDFEGNWQIWDTERGLVAGNDNLITLNTTAAETTNTDYVDPNSSGFQVSSNNNVNVSNGEYFFYAIA